MDRLVAEINAEKKQKSQKSKLKMSLEAKKHLSGVRVVQWNLVYIIGLPANLCDRSVRALLCCQDLFFNKHKGVFLITFFRFCRFLNVRNILVSMGKS